MISHSAKIIDDFEVEEIQPNAVLVNKKRML